MPKKFKPPLDEQPLKLVIGQRLARYRDREGLSQTELGRLLGYLTGRKWTQDQVSNAERGQHEFTVAELFVLAKVFGESAFHFLLPDPSVEHVRVEGFRIDMRALNAQGKATQDTRKLIAEFFDDPRLSLAGEPAPIRSRAAEGSGARAVLDLIPEPTELGSELEPEEKRGFASLKEVHDLLYFFETADFDEQLERRIEWSQLRSPELEKTLPPDVWNRAIRYMHAKGADSGEQT
jgi:transcriptional regulator with XRE-family HTH domain